MEEPNQVITTNVVPFATKKMKNERKTFLALVNVLKALKNDDLVYINLVTVTKDIDKPDIKLPTSVKMHYTQYHGLKEEELQIMIDFLHEGAEDLMKLYFTNPDAPKPA